MPIARSITAAIAPPAIAAVLFPLVAEDMSEPKSAVSNEVKPDLVEVGFAAATSIAVALLMEDVEEDVEVDVEVACNATALELAADGE